ncbi:MAG: ATP-binding protein [Gemmatimonadaceae bacterium]
MLLGPPGVWPTTAISLAIAAAQVDAGSTTARWRISSRRSKKRKRQPAPRSASRRSSSGRCLVVGEIGYLPISRTGAMLFFPAHVAALRTRERCPHVNKSFEEWGEIFGDEVMATALIDRLVHHCHIVNIRGNSYRMKNHAELYAALRPTSQPASRSLHPETRRASRGPPRANWLAAPCTAFQPVKGREFQSVLTG